MNAMPDLTPDARYDAVVRRDSAFDGQFWFSVVTTGVYCRPSCAARTPRPQNVGFHLSCEDAEAAGFRACKRCSPRGESPKAKMAAVIADICRTIETAETEPSLTDLARQAGLSAYHFHRQFKAATGVTPKGYAAAHRARRVREGLTSGETVTNALYDAGYGSNGRFYEESNAILGMTPKQYQAGGRDADVRFAIGQSRLGAVLVAQSDKGIVAISLGDDPDTLVRELQDRFPRARLTGDDADFNARIAQVIGFVEAPQTGLDLPLDIRGTAFQQRVWQALRAIPAGKTLSYAELARAIGSPAAVRAVAGACAANTLAVAVPCHRIVRTDGALSGYRWGVERKRDLLERERVA
ncbi:bifunctional DNA-binding transcriptional regulator/O6-methylguanine-DNA methyltransferase Ada [Asticcacaulis sp. AC402]|uniref:bifunctional DNA-binding transcriptional regulator/O6-methylguanine-DNA methyltransferase Ada n=1 Tax=Asticcacaulis sp. AC402 TaxID=1282361 RepID=UPI0003C40FC8|nr:bifunctional DNA-binding transcriptional regulator/O6-methylguanine-DNA methyltransferase Ada [Asticcacaulis sp. AC402]ESQ75169.1 AraC family transcriptional regulator [Asticcacaulis sp. AC402]